MNELECGLISTVLILSLLLLITTLGWVEDDSSGSNPTAFFLAPRGVVLSNDESSTPERTWEWNDAANAMETAKQAISQRTGKDLDEDLGEDYFLPGSLNLSRTGVLHKCYVPASVKLPAGQGCSRSDKYKIIFHMTPKSGSSTGRHVIKNDFGGVDHFSDSACRAPSGPDHDHWIEVAVLRNPSTRAFASYEEMFVRRLGSPEMIPVNSRAFMEPFRGWLYPNYSALFDTVEGVRKLNDAYEQFMRDWDGKAFDMHLESQVAYNMRRRPGVSNRHSSDHLRFVFDTHSMEESFHQLADMVHLGKKPRVIRGRAYPRRLNVSNVSDEAFQAMCRRYRDDFCCLNYPLPKQCLRNVPTGRRVRCKWTVPEGETEPFIEPVVI